MATLRADTAQDTSEAASPLELLEAAARLGSLPALGRRLAAAWEQVQRAGPVIMARQASQAAVENLDGRVSLVPGPWSLVFRKGQGTRDKGH